MIEQAQHDETKVENPVGIQGLAFIEFAGPDPDFMAETFKKLGCSKVKRHPSKAIDLYKQKKIHFLLNHHTGHFAEAFGKKHGLSACAIGLYVKNAKEAIRIAVERGATAFNTSTYPQCDHELPAVMGVGNSLIYFVEGNAADNSYFNETFIDHPEPEEISDKGFVTIDHLTNNIEYGTRDEWASFYKDIFGFYEIRYFDIRGEKTGLTSFALKSPCHTFAIPINEATEEASQIAEYIREYDGAGIQHIALLSNNLLASLDSLEGSGIETLDIDPSYYEEAFQRVPTLKEDKDHIKRHQALVDGDEEGYIIQIFTKNIFGPIFFEMIQRNNHQSFGEGNFGALFRSIERDQERRGVL